MDDIEDICKLMGDPREREKLLKQIPEQGHYGGEREERKNSPSFL